MAIIEITTLTSYITIITLLVIGIEVEQYYVSRVTVFTNSVALLVHFERLNFIGVSYGLFTVLGLILGGYGMLAYTLNESLSDIYYDAVFYLYSSATVGIVILFTEIWNASTIWIIAGIGLSIFLNTWLYHNNREVMAPIPPQGLSLANALSGSLWRGDR